MLHEQEERRLLYRQRLRHGIAIVLFVGITFGCLLASGLFNPSWPGQAWGRMQRILPEAFPPDLSRLTTHWLRPLLDTAIMSVAGTALGVVIAIPLGLCAARRWSPARWLPLPVRSALGGMRTIPELLLAIVMVICVGPGMLAGTLALTIHSAGMLGKFYHEILEHAHAEPALATRSCGASGYQTIRHGVIAQVFPQLVDVTMFRWECNVRAAMVLGVIGAGGIGQELILAMRVLRYQEAMGMVLIMLIMVIIVDFLSGTLRKRMG